MAPGFVALHGGASSAVLLPALGGKIRELTLGGRQWLWHNSDLPFCESTAEAPYATAGDSGGMDECFPTIAAGAMPTHVRGGGQLLLADHGALWNCAPELTIRTEAAGHAATCVWRGDAWPWNFARTLRMLPSGEVHFAYELRNESANKLPFLWAAHPLFPLTPHTRLELPEGSRTRVWSQMGADFGGAGAEHQWPQLRVGAATADLSRPWTALKESYACKVFVSLPKRPCVLALMEGDARLELLVDGREIPYVGVWINREHWTPFARSRGWRFWRRAPRPYANIGIAPCLGAPDSLSEAIGSWDSASWVEPGATRHWSMTWRAAQIITQPPTG